MDTQNFLKCWLLLILGICCILIPQLGHAAWVNLQGNAQHTGYAAGAFDSHDFGLLWSKSFTLVNPEKLQEVAAAAGIVFVTKSSYTNTAGTITAYDAYSGNQIWQYVMPVDARHETAPAYAQGRLYIHASGHSAVQSGEPPAIYCLDAVTGQMLWKASHSGQGSEHGTPLVYDGSVYTSGGYYGGFQEHNASTGASNWLVSFPQQYGWSPAANDTHAFVYLGSASSSPGPPIARLYAFDRFTGALDYEILNNAANFVSYDPVLGNHNDAFIIDSIGTTKRLVRFDLENRNIAWARPDTYRGLFALADDQLFALKQGALSVVDELTGNELWNWNAPLSVDLQGNVLVTDCYVFVPSRRAIFAIDRITHQSVWSYTLPNSFYSLAMSDGVLYASSVSSVYAFQLDDFNAEPSLPMAPEPSTLLLMGTAVLGASRKRRR